MKIVAKRLFGCFLTFALTIGIIYRLGILVRPVNTDTAFSTINTFHDMPINSIEVIGYGSSHMWRGLDPMVMYRNYGVGAFNYGCNWQHINTTFLFLQDSLRTQSPKIVLIETYLVNQIKMNESNVDGEIYYTRGISMFKGKQEYLKQCLGSNWENYLAYIMPLCAFHENWINLEEGSFSKNTNTIDFYRTMGYFPSDQIIPVTIGDPATFEQDELSEEATRILDEMVNICHERGIEIIFYTAPHEEEYGYSNAMKKYTANNDCVYFNLYEYMEEMGIDCETDFKDPGHLNNSGAAKVADFLGEYIVNNYDVTDMRTVEDNLWEQALQRQ
ncbi:MAG: hypothetical protein ACI4C4_01165 [Lachnospiraceae bacterium]